MTGIVTNAKSRIAYNIVRSLGKKGIEVYTSDFVPFAMSSYSRYSKGSFQYPSPFLDDNKFINCIISYIRHLNANVLIPGYEETFLISRHKDRFLNNVKMVILDYDQILIAHSKDKWISIAKELDIPIPKTFTIHKIQRKPSIILDLTFPVLIKPNQGGGDWAIMQVNCPSDLETLINQDTFKGLSWSRSLVQEKIEGDTHFVAMLFRKGEYKAKVTYKQLRDYPPKQGQATLRESIHNEQAEHYFQ